ncbi:MULTISPECIES: glucosamine-6-phosphate deaminase [unclassified Luteococcus]|uniref:glucosamine-6-phosphate deaminase n=1 Tax=unclassified Luteococcus TaxID=2639923 RepID=UPI00313F231B
MEIIIVDNAEQIGRMAAAQLTHWIRGIEAPVLGVATGSSPLGIYTDLARRVGAEELDLSKASAFALDEYVGLPADHPQSYADTIRRTVTEPLRMDPARVHVPDGMASDIAASCQAYEEAIQQAGGVDVQILGIGPNGHIGFNEPGSSLASRTRIKTLTKSTRQANARYFDDESQVPTHCLTQGLGTILASRHAVLVADGERKAAAIAQMAEGPLGTHCPATALQLHQHVVVVVDEAAASQLQRADEYRDVQRLKPEWQRIQP